MCDFDMASCTGMKELEILIKKHANMREYCVLLYNYKYNNNNHLTNQPNYNTHT